MKKIQFSAMLGAIAASLSLANKSLVIRGTEITPPSHQYNSIPPMPTPGKRMKAAKRRSGVQYRHGKGARK